MKATHFFYSEHQDQLIKIEVALISQGRKQSKIEIVKGTPLNPPGKIRTIYNEYLYQLPIN